MTHDYSTNILLIEAPLPTLEAINAGLGPGQLGATDRVPLEVHDFGAAGIRVRYAVAGDTGVDAIHALATRWPDAAFTLTFDYTEDDDAQQGWSGFARWAGGALIGHETDDPTLDANDGELHREGILVTSEVDDYDSAVLAPSRWAAVCGLARRQGWSPPPWILRAIESPPEPLDGVLDKVHPCGHVELEVVVVPGVQALRLADALDAAIATYGVPPSVRGVPGVQAQSLTPGGPAAADPLDRATPRVVRAVRDLARVGTDLRVTRLLRCRPSGN